MKKGLFVVLVLVLVVAFAASAIYLAAYFTDSAKSQMADNDRADKVSQMRQEYTESQTTQATETTEPQATAGADPTETSFNPYGTPGVSGYEDEYFTPDELEPENIPERPVLQSGSDLLPWYQELHDENPDMIGWLEIQDSKINYPVMQTSLDNPNYYLYRDFDKNESYRGCIYAREECDVFKPSDNITLFGHNMKDGSMFAYLGNYYNKSTWEENPLIFFDTLTESHVYKIFAVFKTSGTDGVGFAYHLMADAENEEEFNQFVATCKELAFYDTGITPVYGDKLLCLSTCEYTIDNGLFVVAAVRIT